MAVSLWGAAARADGNDLSISVRGFPSWAAAISVLQSDTHAEGRSLAVAVLHSDHTRASCDRYRLALDAVGGAAFAVGICDPVTGETTVTLVHRAALFAHDDVVPEPLSAGITAVAVSTGGAAGGASPRAESALTCSVAVQPYLTDLEHGRRVPLTPGRFVLRPIGATVRVDAGTDGWTLVALSAGSLSIEYDIFDTARGRVIAHDRASIRCANESVTSAPVIATEPPSHPPASAQTETRDAPLPIVTASFTGNLAGVGYVPLAEVPLHHDGLVATGRDLQNTAAWTYAPMVGAMLDAPWFRGTLGLVPHVGDHFAGIQAVAMAAFAVQIDHARIYVGPHYALSAFRLSRVAGRDVDWTTGGMSSLGATAGIAYRATSGSVNGRARVSDVHFDVAIPLWGSGAIVAGFGLAWGGAL